MQEKLENVSLSLLLPDRICCCDLKFYTALPALTYFYDSKLCVSQLRFYTLVHTLFQKRCKFATNPTLFLHKIACKSWKRKFVGKGIPRKSQMPGSQKCAKAATSSASTATTGGVFFSFSFFSYSISTASSGSSSNRSLCKSVLFLFFTNAW